MRKRAGPPSSRLRRTKRLRTRTGARNTIAKESLYPHPIKTLASFIFMRRTNTPPAFARGECHASTTFSRLSVVKGDSARRAADRLFLCSAAGCEATSCGGVLRSLPSPPYNPTCPHARPNRARASPCVSINTPPVCRMYNRQQQTEPRRHSSPSALFSLR